MSSNAALGPTQDAYNKNSSTSDQALNDYRGTEAGYLSNVNSAIAAGNPFKSRDYLTSQNLMTSGAMNSENDAAQNQLQQTAARTGTNTAALANEVGENARAGQRALTGYNAQRDTENENNWLNERDKLFGDQQAGANSQAGVYGTTKGAENSDLSDFTSAANADQKSKNETIQAGIEAGGAVATGFAGCSAAGALYLMADGSSKPVELIAAGDKLAGIDFETQTVEEVRKAVAPVLLIVTSDGFRNRVSPTHAFALPAGGFIEASRSLHRTIRTEKGMAHVVSVSPDGSETVYNVMTDGSHTYRADGMWAVGAGDSER